MNNFLLETLKLGWVAFHSVIFQLKCLDFQSNHYKKLVPVLSRFCDWLCAAGEFESPEDGCGRSWYRNDDRMLLPVTAAICQNGVERPAIRWTFEMAIGPISAKSCMDSFKD